MFSTARQFLTATIICWIAHAGICRAGGDTASAATDRPVRIAKRRLSGLKKRKLTGLKPRKTTGLKKRKTSGLKKRKTTGLKQRKTTGLKKRHLKRRRFK